VRLSNLIEKNINQTVYLEVLQELGSPMLIYVLVYYSYLAIGGMLQELCTEKDLLESQQTLEIKLNLVYLKSLGMKPQEEYLERFN